MFQTFANYLSRTADFNNQELALIKKASLLRKIPKRELILKEGQIAHYNIFVVKGCLRLFSVNVDGFEHTVRFAIEDWWISDYESYHSEQPSKYNIEALEDCELILIPRNELASLYTTIPKFKNLKDEWEAKCAGISQHRIHSIISETAEQKYNWFIKNNAQIFNRVPLHMIASYLGLSRETISRVRRRFVKERSKTA